MAVSIKQLVREWKENPPMSDVIYNFTLLPNNIFVQGRIKITKIKMKNTQYQHLFDGNIIMMSIMSIDNKCIAKIILNIITNTETNTETFCSEFPTYMSGYGYISKFMLFQDALETVQNPEIVSVLSRNISYEIPLTRDMNILVEPAEAAEMRAMTAMKNAAAADV
jgi:hypothetical protein